MKNKLKTVAAVLTLAFCLSLCAGALGQDNVPTAENLEITTYRGVSVGGKLSASSPNGGELIFEICTPPTKGALELGDDGCFVYTPNEGRRGRDYFGYRAIDTDGNCSQEATVIIRIQKQKTKLEYSDMEGRREAFAAITLAENDIFVGESLAGSYVFRPEETISRAEFLAMCMKLVGTEPLTGISSTGFADDRDIDAWAKPYVSTALLCGIIDGYQAEESAAVFRPDAAVTTAEAAVMLNRALELTDAVAVWAQLDASTPTWARQAAANLSVAGLLTEGTGAGDDELTRARAAELLCAAMSIANNS